MKSSLRRTVCLACAALCIAAFFGFIVSLSLGKSGDTRQFEDFAEKLFQNEMLASTLNMHYTLADPAAFGITEYEPLLPHYEAGDALQSAARLEPLLAALRDIRPDKLSADHRDTYTLLYSSLENSHVLASYPYYEEPLSPNSGMQSQLPILLAEYPFRTVRDVEDYLALLDQTDEYFASLLLYEQEKAAAGLLASSDSIRKVIAQCDSILHMQELESGTHFLQTTFRERLQPLLESGLLSDAQSTLYCAQNDRLLRTVMLPAYEALGDGLLVLMDPAIPMQGLANLAQGAAYYETLLRSQTGSDRSVPEIKQLLQSQLELECQAVKALLEEYPALLEEQSDRGTTSLTSLCREQFPLQDPAQMLADLVKRMADAFPTANAGPAADTGQSVPTISLKPVSASLAPYTAPAFYLTPPLDDTSCGAIYINELLTPNGLELYTTLAHEGYPGHMYQSVYHNRLALSKTGDAVPVRELLWYGGYLEGWALYVEFEAYGYAEALCRETADTRAAADIQAAAVALTRHDRSMTLCIYSLLDIAIHYEGADIARVTDFLAGFGITDEASVSAVYEYIVEEPVNYLKYYLGYLEILELKKEAGRLWQEGYSDMRFHTFLLEQGPADFQFLTEKLSSEAISSR